MGKSKKEKSKKREKGEGKYKRQWERASFMN